ncbi:MAG: hypothetical protein PVJ04_13215 [Gemmatimonadota bacterium]|jgi:hypothetical protein
MRRDRFWGLTLGLALALFASPAAGQGYKYSVGWSGGAFLTTSLNNGAAAQEGGDLKPDMSWAGAMFFDHWLGSGRVGGRLHGALGQQTIPWIQGDRDIQVYEIDVTLMLRFAPATLDRTVSPFLSLGGGVIHWGMGDGPVTSYLPAAASYDGTQNFDLIAVGGLGFDIITPWSWGDGPLIVRLEGRDHVQFNSPFDPLDADASKFGIIHNIYASLGVHTGIGVLGGSF